MSRRFLMALDAGGGSGRCLVVDVDSGEVVTRSRRWTHPIAPDTDGWGLDLKTETVWRLLGEAAREAVQQIGGSAEQVAAVAVTGMRHGSVVVNAVGEVLLATPSRDARGAAQSIALAAERGAELHQKVGHWPAPLFGAARLLWMAEHMPERLRQAHALLGIGEWLGYRMTGRMVAEPSVASETLLFDVARPRWDEALIAGLDLPKSIFPEVATAGSQLGTLTATAAQHMGLRVGTPVVVGGGDTQCALLGSGAVGPGELGIVAGSTMPMQLVVDEPIIDAQTRLWTCHHVVPGRWVLESNAGMCGCMLEWLADMFCAGAQHPVATFLGRAAESSPGAGGMLSTLGAEVFNASQMGLPVGNLTLSPLAAGRDALHRAHVMRAVVEGMAFGVRANVDQLREVAGSEPVSLRIGGGMSRSAFWSQLVCDVLNRPIQVSEVQEVTALGAAMCAAVGAGLYRDLGEASAALARPGRVHEPARGAVETYAELYAQWSELRSLQSEADAHAAGLALSAIAEARTGAPSAARGEASFRPRILVTASMDDASLQELRRFADVEYASFRDELRLLGGEDLVSALSGFHVLVTEVDVVDADALRALPDLRVVVSCRGKAVNLDIPACTAFGIPVLTTPGRNSDAVADLTVAFMLMLARKLPAATQFLRDPSVEAGDTARMGMGFEQLQGQELWHRTVGLVGFGAIGRKVARRLTPFDVRLLAHDPFSSDEQIAAAGAEAASLDRLLSESDFVCLHAAEPADGHALIGAAELGRMKAGAFLVNTARASLVDESALACSLRTGHLGGVALDVFSVEPPGADHCLLTFDNVIATPHVGGNTEEVSVHQGVIVCEDITRLLRGEKPVNIANPETLAGFAWSGPRKAPSDDDLDRLRQGAGPAVSDLEGAAKAAGADADAVESAAADSEAAPRRSGVLESLRSAFGGKTQAEPAASEQRPAGPGPDLNAARAQMERLLGVFLERLATDEGVLSRARGKPVIFQYELPDIELSFYTVFEQGSVTARLGDSPTKPHVRLKMKAGVLDSLFSGRANGAKLAMSGKMSFSGDTLKAMSMQRMQKDLNRVYQAAREEVGGFDPPRDEKESAAQPAAVAPGAPAPAVVASTGDERDEIIAILEELYAAGLITSTGGNISARITGSPNEAWITPNNLFKGALRPDMMVRIDMDGNQIDSGARAPSSERMIHAAILRNRPEINAVIHAHPQQATTLGLAGLPFLPISTEAAFIGEIPRVPFIMPGTDELACAVAEAAKEAPVVLLENHGLIVAGSDLRRAADMTAVVEQTAEKIIACYSLKEKPKVLPDEMVLRLRELGEMLG